MIVLANGVRIKEIDEYTALKKGKITLVQDTTFQCLLTSCFRQVKVHGNVAN